MRIGILVNSDRHLAEIIGLTNAATKSGHTVELFAMDDGTRLLEDPSYTALAELGGVTMSFCDHSAKDLQVKTEGVPEKIACSSQFSNAQMNHNADRMLVL